MCYQFGYIFKEHHKLHDLLCEHRMELYCGFWQYKFNNIAAIVHEGVTDCSQCPFTDNTIESQLSLTYFNIGLWLNLINNWLRLIIFHLLVLLKDSSRHQVIGHRFEAGDGPHISEQRAKWIIRDAVKQTLEEEHYVRYQSSGQIYAVLN